MSLVHAAATESPTLVTVLDHPTTLYTVVAGANGTLIVAAAIVNVCIQS